MSTWKLDNKTGYATWDDPVATWDDPLVAWDGVLDVWDKQTKNSSTFTLETKNEVTSAELELLIDDTYELDIGDGFSLLIQSEGAGYSLQAKNPSTYTLQDKTTTNSYELLIDDTYELDIGDGFSLLIESGGEWQLQTKN